MAYYPPPGQYPPPQQPYYQPPDNTDTVAMILDGKGNKEIAHTMSRSLRTVEDHRSHIMKKLGVDNMIDLIKHFAVVKPPDLSENDD